MIHDVDVGLWILKTLKWIIIDFIFIDLIIPALI